MLAGAHPPVDSTSASSGVLMASFLTVAYIIGPISSRSGKKTSKDGAGSGSRITEMTQAQGLVGFEE